MVSEAQLARWWETKDDGRILCTLCPRYCQIGEDQYGFCFIRQNHGGKLYNLGYGRSTGFAVDPIEKKPLNHFLPGGTALSFGTAGCNLGCRFCQNWSISKAKLDDRRSRLIAPDEVVELARREGCDSIAFTYNDPTIFGEFVIDIARVARATGIKSIMVTAGYIDERAREEIYAEIDAANVDLKAFTEQFYRKLTFSHIKPVLETIRWLVHETDVWVELTNLLIPEHNDSPSEIAQMCDWILAELGDGVPIHFTAFHPDYKLTDKPRTPPQTLIRARQQALEKGLRYVYVGNIFDDEGQATYCGACNARVIDRSWHAVTLFRLDAEGCCPDCGHQIPGRFKGAPGLSHGRRRETHL